MADEETGEADVLEPLVEVLDPLPCVDEDVLVFLDWRDDEDFILLLEDPTAKRGKKSRLPLWIALVLLLLAGGGFALWWFALR